MINLLIIAFCLHSELKTKQKDGIYLMPLKAGIYIVITDACHLHTQMGGQVLSGWFGNGVGHINKIKLLYVEPG